ncbi:ALK tyrosine kinase receptor-like [Octopus vulgaris]|uniref:ALK tyrosine kinase receptor-like n=1 Tax=Octopus vulgaris TaxID=6645 RepID=A0AA36BBJ4_OCTVU|nr:ALK tyrosine kinase receptor-like [Octopus vulgaris]
MVALIPRARSEHIMIIHSLKPNESVLFVSPLFLHSLANCKFSYGGLFQNVNLTLVIENESNTVIEEMDQISLTHGKFNNTVLVGEMKDAFRIGFQISVTNNSSAYAIFYFVAFDNCSNESLFCPLYEVSCNDLTCISRDQKCDIEQNCETLREDETGCDDLPRCALCSFEEDFCCWRNSQSNKELKWVRHLGSTPTEKTGPFSDHTSGSGYYIYTQLYTDSPSYAILESVVFPPPPQPTIDNQSLYLNTCKVRFFYHFHGYHVVGLILKIVNVCDSNQSKTTLWRKSDTLLGGEDAWNKVVAVINVTYSYSLQINAICGSGKYCNIAIDDISLSPECFAQGLLEATNGSAMNAAKYKKNATFYHNSSTVCYSDRGDSPLITERNGSTRFVRHNVFNMWLVISILISLTSMVAAYLFWKRRQRLIMASRVEHLKTMCKQAPIIPLARDGDRIGTEINPTYDISMMYPESANIRQLPRSHVYLVRPIGQGAFGEVYQGYLSNIVRGYQEYPVAVKTLPALSTEQAGQDFVTEAIIMSKFNHPNIVKFLGVCFESHPKYIVLELLNGGDLRNFLRENRPKPDTTPTISTRDLMTFTLHVAKGCQHLAKNRFIHRDIAARNCLLTSKGEKKIAKIADFGMARDIYRSDYYKKDGRALLPVKWMPPEAFIDGIFSTKTDVWSFGVLLWEIFSLGCSPYPGLGNQDVIQHVTYGGRMGKPRSCPDAIFEVMLSCWNSDANERPDFNIIMEVITKCSQDEEIMSSQIPSCYCPLIAEPVIMPVALPYRGAKKVRMPKSFVRSSDRVTNLNSHAHPQPHHNLPQHHHQNHHQHQHQHHQHRHHHHQHHQQHKSSRTKNRMPARISQTAPKLTYASIGFSEEDEEKDEELPEEEEMERNEEVNDDNNNNNNNNDDDDNRGVERNERDARDGEDKDGETVKTEVGRENEIDEDEEEIELRDEREIKEDMEGFKKEVDERGEEEGDGEVYGGSDESIRLLNVATEMCENNGTLTGNEYSYNINGGDNITNDESTKLLEEFKDSQKNRNKNGETSPNHFRRWHNDRNQRETTGIGQGERLALLSSSRDFEFRIETGDSVRSGNNGQQQPGNCKKCSCSNFLLSTHTNNLLPSVHYQNCDSSDGPKKQSFSILESLS